MAVDHAVAAGLGRGEYGGFYSSLRTFSMVLAPIIFDGAYSAGINPQSSVPTGATWLTVT